MRERRNRMIEDHHFWQVCSHKLCLLCLMAGAGCVCCATQQTHLVPVVLHGRHELCLLCCKAATASVCYGAHQTQLLSALSHGRHHWCLLCGTTCPARDHRNLRPCVTYLSSLIYSVSPGARLLYMRTPSGNAPRRSDPPTPRNATQT